MFKGHVHKLHVPAYVSVYLCVYTDITTKFQQQNLFPFFLTVQDLLDLFINECDIRPEDDDSQNAIIIYKDG